MDEKHRNALRINRVALVKDLVVNEELFAHLEQSDVFTDSMVDEIKVQPTRQKKAAELLNMLTRRGPKAFGIFVDALVCTSQSHLAGLLEPEYAGRGEEKQIEPTPMRVPTQPTEDREGGILSVTVQHIDEVDAAKTINKVQEGDVYPMCSKPRGRAIIISNEHFKTESSRDGSVWDLINLDMLFTQLGFETVTHKDLTAKAINDVLEEEKEQQQLSANAFILCVLSHGVNGFIFGVDGKRIAIDKITSKFDGNNCTALSGKPKVFIIQACQGELSTQGVPQSDSVGSKTEGSVDEMEELRIGDAADSMPSLPNVHEKADTILAYSTVSGYKSWRLPESGSWFIRELVKTFADFAYKEHFLDLLVKVHNRVSEKCTGFDERSSRGLYVQMPETRHTLKKKFYLFPGYYE